jgi:hypothetical protein
LVFSFREFAVKFQRHTHSILLVSLVLQLELLSLVCTSSFLRNVRKLDLKLDRHVGAIISHIMATAISDRSTVQ